MAHSQVVEDCQRMRAQEGNIAARCTAAARDVGRVAYLLTEFIMLPK